MEQSTVTLNRTSTSSTNHPVLELCLFKGILTGSRAFLVPTADSDWDIVITESQVPYKELNQFDWETCASWEDHYEPYDADGVDSIDEMYDGTVWGPILNITKWYIYDDDDQLTTINLFIYQDKEHQTVQKFTQVNALMMFTLTKEQRQHKPTRIAKFIEILKELKIT